MPRPPATVPLPYLLYRTTPRDRWIAAMTAEHRALTATHIHALAFGTLRATNRRLAELTALGVLDRTRARTGLHTVGAYLYTLAPAGALLVGATSGLSVKELRYDRAVLLRQAARPDLPHTLGCNTLMVNLATRNHTAAGPRLTTWWSAVSCLRLWGDVIRPDAYAVTHDTERDQAEGWFLEYDTGTESITQLAGKIRAYTRYAQQYAGHRPVLIHLPTTSREHRLHEVIAATYPQGCPVPIATATAPDLAAPVWRLAGAPDAQPRHHLGQLPWALSELGYRLLAAQHSDPEIHAPAPTRDLAGASFRTVGAVITRIAALTAAAVLLVVVLIAAAAGAVTGILTEPIDTAGQASDSSGSTVQLDAAQFCALGKITPGRATGYGTYTTDQIANATTIYQVSRQLGLPQYAAVIATATALQESDLENIDYGDQDSLGLFQQRPSQGWGTPAQIINPTYAATKFYDALVKVPDWQTIPLTEAAQDVQKSAYPDAYAAHTTAAEYLVSTVSGALDNCPAAKQ